MGEGAATPINQPRAPKGGVLLRAPSHRMHEVRQKQITKEAMEFEQAEEALQKQLPRGAETLGGEESGRGRGLEVQFARHACAQRNLHVLRRHPQTLPATATRPRRHHLRRLEVPLPLRLLLPLLSGRLPSWPQAACRSRDLLPSSRTRPTAQACG